MKRSAWHLWLSILCLALFSGLVTLVAAGQPIVIDEWAAGWPGADRRLALSAVADGVRLIGSTATFILTPLAGALIWRRDRLAAWILVLAFVVSFVVSIVVKLLVARARPFDANAGLPVDSDETSFPSTSVVICVVFWGVAAAMALVSGGFHGWRKALTIVAVVLIALCGPARLYAGDHWLTDVLAGYLLAFATVGAALMLYWRSFNDSRWALTRPA